MPRQLRSFHNVALPNKSLQRPPRGICRASCIGFYFCGQQARQLPGGAELKR